MAGRYPLPAKGGSARDGERKLREQFGASAGDRTRDLRIKSPLLYQLSYRRKVSVFLNWVFAASFYYINVRTFPSFGFYRSFGSFGLCLLLAGANAGCN